MAIIPRYTSRALPPGAQPGMIESALDRGRAGARLAEAAGDTIVVGVKFYESLGDGGTKKIIGKSGGRNGGGGTSGKTGGAGRQKNRSSRMDEKATAKPVADGSVNLTSKVNLKREENKKLDGHSVETRLARAETEITKYRAKDYASAKMDAGPAKGMTPRLLGNFDGEAGKLAEGLKDQPHLKSRFDAMVDSSRAPHELRLLTLENARRVDEEKGALADSLGGLAQAAVHDPAMAPGVTGRGFAQIESAMQAGMLAPEEAAAMQGAFAENVHMSAMRGQIAIDPEGTQTRLVAGEFDEVFDAPARDRLIGEARTTARLKTAGASAAARAKRRGLEIDMADHLAALDETGLADEAVAARAQAELPETEHAAFQASQAQARERHATRTEYAFMTPAEIEADIAQRAEGGPANIDRRDGAHAIRKAIRDEILAARAADPAGWAMRDDEVAAAFAAAQENRDDPMLARKALALRLALQREMGIEQPRLLSDAERDEIAGALAQATPADRPALIADLRARYGAQANLLAAELAGEVDTNTALLIAHAAVPQLPRLLAQGMEKAKKDGPAKLTLASPDALNDLPALPMVGTGVPGGYKLDIPNLKSGWTYRAPGGAALFYNGEILVPSTVEIAPAASPTGASGAPGPAPVEIEPLADPTDPDAPTPPLPLGKANPAGEGIALERNGEGNPGAAAQAKFNSDGGFWMFDLPLTVEGKVNEDALTPGSVYQIPESAGGGTGQWKSGMFYNFDQEGDWRLRTVGDLDAYAGVSDALTPEERQEQAIDDLDKAFMPAADLNDDDIGTFTKETGYGLTRGEGGFTLTDPSGQELFDLAGEDAAELARIWSPEIASQIATMGLPWREDLTPEEKRRLLAEAIGADKLGPARKYITGRGRAANVGRDAKRHLIERRMKAYDDLAAGMERGASDEDIGELLDNFNAAMMPEVFGTERFVREFAMDLVPILGNARSVRHLQNDIAEVERAMETGEWGDAAWAGSMAILDFVGIFPGGNLLKAGGDKFAKGVRTVARPFARLVPRKLRARWELAKFIRNATVPLPSMTAKEYFAKVWDDLPPHMQTFLDKRYRNFAGQAGENIVGRNLDEAGIKLRPKSDKRFEFGQDGEENLRIFDHVTSEEIREGLLGIFVPTKKGTRGSSIEVKVATSAETANQLAGNAAAIKGRYVSANTLLRLPADRIKPEDLADVITSWLEKNIPSGPGDVGEKLTKSGEIPVKEIEDLIARLQAKTGPDGEPLDTGEVAAMAIGFALSLMYSGGSAPDAGVMSIDPNAA